jgi:hypothetical protein
MCVFPGLDANTDDGAGRSAILPAMTLVKDRLYHTDYYAWTQEQAAILRRLAARRTQSDLDLENLAEEVADLGKSERRAVRSQMRRLIEHLLQLDHGTSPNPRAGWRRTILDARIELADDLTPTLRRELETDLETLYAAARDQAAEALETHDDPAAAQALPATCPYTLAQLLDRRTLPKP